MRELLNEFLKQQGAMSHKLDPLIESDNRIISLLQVGSEKYIYKISKNRESAKSINEIKALEFLRENFPNKEFYPKIILSNDAELIMTYLSGTKYFPFELSLADTAKLGRILNRLAIKSCTPYFSLDRLDQLQEGSSYDITLKMINEYMLPKLDILKKSRYNFAETLEKKSEKILSEHKELLEANKIFHFFHFDLVNNIILDEDNIKLIDWEKSGYGDPAYNLAVLGVIGKCSSEQEKALMKEFYESNNSQFLERYEFYKKIALLNNFLWLHEKTEVEKIQPETIWNLKDLEFKLMSLI